jgi:hypothetical protein
MAPVPKKPHPTKVTIKVKIPHGNLGGGGGSGAAPKAKVKATKATQKTRMTAKQYKAYLQYLRVHHYGFSAPKSTPRRAARPAGTDMIFPARTYWVLGGNDTLDTCAMTALANQLLQDERARASDEEIMAAGEGLSLRQAVEWAGEHGLGGWQLGDAFPVRPDPRALLLPGMVLGMQTPWGPHAVVTTGGGMAVSWGRLLRVKPPMMVNEAWYLEWKTPEGGVSGRSWLRSVGS